MNRLEKIVVLVVAVLLQPALARADENCTGGVSSINGDSSVCDTISALSFSADSSYSENIFVEERTILGLKTNLLYDAASVLNFSVEGAINDRFSILYEHHCPWWRTKNNRYCLEMLSLGGEFRWWFFPTCDKYVSRKDLVFRDALVGHFLGVYGFGGKFDIQAKDFGCYQGEFLSAGLTYGFSLPICKRLNLEFSVSAGYADIPYCHYIPVDDYQILVRDRDRQGRLHYFGLTKIEVALVVPILISYRTKGGGR